MQRSLFNQLCLFLLFWAKQQTFLSGADCKLQREPEFHNVTLVCNDNQTLQAHEVMLAADSIVFRGLLRKHPHAHPLIYMRGGDQHPDGGGAGLHLPRPDDPAGPGEFPGPGRELGNPGDIPAVRKKSSREQQEKEVVTLHCSTPV